MMIATSSAVFEAWQSDSTYEVRESWFLVEWYISSQWLCHRSLYYRLKFSASVKEPRPLGKILTDAICKCIVLIQGAVKKSLIGENTVYLFFNLIASIMALVENSIFRFLFQRQLCLMLPKYYEWCFLLRLPFVPWLWAISRFYSFSHPKSMHSLLSHPLHLLISCRNADCVLVELSFRLVV